MLKARCGERPWIRHDTGPLGPLIFIVRYNSPITEAAPGTATLTYSDLVAVDVSSGMVRLIVTGFVNPLAVLADDHSGRLLIADYSNKNI
jgi:hypothetical protein